MRVGDGDGRDAAHRLDRLDHGFIEQRQAVPQDVGLRRAQEQGPLADGEVRLDADADQPRLLELDGVSVGQIAAGRRSSTAGRSS